MSADETGLGATIRAWRDRLTAADVGLPSGRARRAAGLRREELAELAGVSVDYVAALGGKLELVADIGGHLLKMPANPAA